MVSEASSDAAPDEVEERTEHADRPSRSPEPVPVVGIGASAGGFEALGEMLEALPEDTGMAFVIVIHLDPERESQIADLLSQRTSMSVVQVEDDVEVEPNHVYTIPSDAFLQIEDGHLRLAQRSRDRGHQNTVDRFFESLAEDVGNQAVGILLSGTLTDGVVGLKEIRQAGGVTIAQDPATARFREMPQAAIDAEIVDMVLAPDRIGRELDRLRRHPYLREGTIPERKEETTGWDEDDLEAVFEELKRATSIEFDHYKKTTVQRRLLRRMMTTNCSDLSEYVERLREDPEELNKLKDELLILVTRFFRDEEFYEALEKEIIPEILENGTSDSPVRIWVPGCSTGQEAYSIAMLLQEHVNEHRDLPYRVFATDVSEDAIDTAREGLYPVSIESEVSERRLQQHFQRVEGGYQIKKSIRNNCIFAIHDLTRDPPFANVDLVSCRNVVIYLDNVLQERALGMFHYALNPDGVLALGQSEGIGRAPDLFRAADVGAPFFKPRAVSGRATQRFSIQGPLNPGVDQPQVEPFDYSEATDHTGDADRLLLERFAPPAVVVNEDMEIVAFRGDTSPYFRTPSGRATFSLMKLAREGLGSAIGNAIDEASEEGRPVTHEGVTFANEGQRRTVDIQVAPLPGPNRPGGGFLVVLDEHDPDTDASRSGHDLTDAVLDRVRHWVLPESSDKDERIRNLERELESTREYLESLTERYEATTEELRSANEEALSTNEELQSTNEELETAKEELQATNEELVTLNDELQARNETIEQINDDLINLLNSVQLPIVMLGSGLKIRRFTDAAGELLNLIDGDVGRPLTDLNLPLDVDQLEKLMLDVLDNLQVEERRIETEDGDAYQLRVQPYRTSDDKINGVVLVLLESGSEQERVLGDGDPGA